MLFLIGLLFVNGALASGDLVCDFNTPCTNWTLMGDNWDKASSSELTKIPQKDISTKENYFAVTYLSGSQKASFSSDSIGRGSVCIFFNIFVNGPKAETELEISEETFLPPSTIKTVKDLNNTWTSIYADHSVSLVQAFFLSPEIKITIKQHVGNSEVAIDDLTILKTSCAEGFKNGKIKVLIPMLVTTTQPPTESTTERLTTHNVTTTPKQAETKLPSVATTPKLQITTTKELQTKTTSKQLQTKTTSEQLQTTTSVQPIIQNSTTKQTNSQNSTTKQTNSQNSSAAQTETQRPTTIESIPTNTTQSQTTTTTENEPTQTSVSQNSTKFQTPSTPNTTTEQPQRETTKLNETTINQLPNTTAKLTTENLQTTTETSSVTFKATLNESNSEQMSNATSAETTLEHQTSTEVTEMKTEKSTVVVEITTSVTSESTEEIKSSTIITNESATNDDHTELTTVYEEQNSTNQNITIKVVDTADDVENDNLTQQQNKLDTKYWILIGIGIAVLAIGTVLLAAYVIKMRRSGKDNSFYYTNYENSSIEIHEQPSYSGTDNYTFESDLATLTKHDRNEDEH